MELLLVMKKKEFQKIVQEKVVILDGSMGVFLQKKGMPADVCPEQWVCEHPKVAADVMEAYIQAGADIIYAPTFGGNRLKLDEYGLGEQTYEINKKLVQLAKQTARGRAFVAGDLTMTGQQYEPFGEKAFEDAVDIYKEQISALVDGGADLLIIETMMDIQETRAAVIAAKETCHLPVMVTMTFDESGRTMNGTDPVSAMVVLQNLGADAVGCNCSTGPDDMLPIIKAMRRVAKVPIIAKPNAGVPKLINGATCFDMDCDMFVREMQTLIEAGAGIVGGCCGTTPEFINKLSQASSHYDAPKIHTKQGTILSSGRDCHEIGSSFPVTIIGERINPTGKKQFQNAIKNGDYRPISIFAREQIEAGAEVLDVNVGMSGVIEEDLMVNAVNLLAGSVTAPLCIDSSNEMAVERALRVYPGRALVNSVSLEQVKIDKFIPIAAKYGAAVILLPLSDDGLPKNALERQVLTQKIYEHLKEVGYQKEDIIIDGLTMTVSAGQENAIETLAFIRWVAYEFGCNTTLGLSNISFGLPERGRINASFLSLAMANGLTAAIANPSDEMLMSAKHANDVLLLKDKEMKTYIRTYSGRKIEKEKAETNQEEKSVVDKLYEAVLYGYQDEVYEITKNAYQEKKEAMLLLNNYMIPAITKAGDLFETHDFFLPELIKSAAAMNKGFDYLKPFIEQEGTGEKGPKVILATVKGDVHEIGKNIVKIMLENHGFEVIDLGKNVDEAMIIATLKETGAKLVGLSALMTTTMTQMKIVIDAIKKKGYTDVKVMVGGAVITPEFAKEIGADGYSEDANAAVKLAKALLSYE